MLFLVTHSKRKYTSYFGLRGMIKSLTMLYFSLLCLGLHSLWQLASRRLAVSSVLYHPVCVNLHTLPRFYQFCLQYSWTFGFASSFTACSPTQLPLKCLHCCQHSSFKNLASWYCSHHSPTSKFSIIFHFLTTSTIGYH